jgi:hypothetical protein
MSHVIVNGDQPEVFEWPAAEKFKASYHDGRHESPYPWTPTMVRTATGRWALNDEFRKGYKSVSIGEAAAWLTEAGLYWHCASGQTDWKLLSGIPEVLRADLKQATPAAVEATTAVAEPLPPGDIAPDASGDATHASPKRKKRGDASLLIRGVLETFASAGNWNASEKEIYERANVSKTTYEYVMAHDDKAKRVREEYDRKRLGTGPIRHKCI